MSGGGGGSRSEVLPCHCVPWRQHGRGGIEKMLRIGTSRVCGGAVLILGEKLDRHYFDP